MKPVTAVILCLTLACAGHAGSFVLTRDGRPACTIVIAAEPSPAAGFAAAELQQHVKRITGAILPVKADAEPVDGPRILVGESEATRALRLRSRSLGFEEHVIRFLPNTLVLMGNDARPTGGLLPRTDEGKSGQAQRFGGNQCIELRDLQFDDDCGTMEAWVWLPAAQSDRHGTILRMDGTNPWTYHIIQRDMNSNRISYTTYDGTNGHGLSSGELAEGWHHVVGTHDVGTGLMELFIDGQSVGKTSYVKTTCRGVVMGIGGIAQGDNAAVGNPFTGLIDEVRITNDVRTPRTGAAGGPCEYDGATLALLHLEQAGVAGLSGSAGDFTYTPPRIFQSNGTLYAVYDFLERYCNVRWYAPGDIGIVCPQTPTLVARGSDLQRAPSMIHRWIAGGYLFMPTPKERVADLDAQTYRLRNRIGGRALTVGHSFYGYYDRFLKDHPDWFAQGYGGQPPQLCYTNPGLIAQVVQDARDYFDGKGVSSGAASGDDLFGLVPMDNSEWCKCERCQAELNPDEKDNPQFNNGYASDYIFNFTNKVARELAKTHPDKWIGQLAYSAYAYYPAKIVPERNVSVQLCLHTRNWWTPSMEANDRRVLREWTADRDRPVYLWLYYCFPALNAKYGAFNYRVKNSSISFLPSRVGSSASLKVT